MTLRPPRASPRRRGAGEGVVTVFVADEQRDQPVDVPRWGGLAEDVLRAEGIEGEAELSLLFVDRETIATLNGDFLGVDGPTDVLSFPIDGELAPSGRWPDDAGPGPDRRMPDLDDVPMLLGDVIICPDVAAENAPLHAGVLDDELALLVVHGILHLLGMDHESDDERVAMQGRERALLAEFYGTMHRDPWT
ncbi:MAG: rRNA maturation RNase YbeY [Actinomycetes bacterium]